MRTNSCWIHIYSIHPADYKVLYPEHECSCRITQPRYGLGSEALEKYFHMLRVLIGRPVC